MLLFDNLAQSASKLKEKPILGLCDVGFLVRTGPIPYKRSKQTYRVCSKFLFAFVPQIGYVRLGKKTHLKVNKLVSGLIGEYTFFAIDRFATRSIPTSVTLPFGKVTQLINDDEVLHKLQRAEPFR